MLAVTAIGLLSSIQSVGAADTLVIGIVADPTSPLVMKRLEIFRSSIANSLGRQAALFTAGTAAELIDAHASGRVDYAIMTSLGYATTRALCDCVEPLVAPTAANGAYAIKSVLVSRVDTLEALSQSTIATGPSTSFSTAIVPRHDFEVGGKSLENLGAQIIAAPSAEAANELVRIGEVDAAFSWIFGDGQKSGGTPSPGAALALDETLDVKIVWKSPAYRYGPHSVRQSLDRPTKVLLRDVLVNLSSTDPAAFDAISPDLGGGFVPVTHSDYDEVMDMVTTPKN